MRPYNELYRRWIAVPGIQAADIAVLSALYAHADRDGVCAATQGELAEELGQSRAWINAILKALQGPDVALVAARTRRGYRGFLYALTAAADTTCQPADSGGPPADRLLDPGNPESSSSQRGWGSALPVDWAPSAEDVAWAGTQRPDVDPAAVTAKFVAWCRKAHGRNGYRPADPGAAWRRWILRELVADPAGASDSAAVPPSPHRPCRTPRHERPHRPAAERAAPGTGVAARNRDTLAALRHRLSCPA